MNKEELKNLVATKIANQGNQVDLGGALASVLNELIDGAPERAPITINLSRFDIPTQGSVDVSSAIPSGFFPTPMDRVVYDGTIWLWDGGHIEEDGSQGVILFGIANLSGETEAKIRLVLSSNEKWRATLIDY